MIFIIVMKLIVRSKNISCKDLRKIEEAPKEEKLEIAENIEEAPVVETPTVETVEVTCNDDAKDYMAEKFGVARSKMRSREQIEKVAKEYGVVFDWK